MNTRQTLAKRFGVVTVAGAMLLGSAVMIGGPASAHEGTPHPAHIHTGQCPAPGDVVFPLNDLGGENATNGTPMATEPMGSTSAVPVDLSMTTVDSALNDLLDGNHAIVVHESKENIQNYILCGDLGGTVIGGTDLAIGLSQLNDSGYSGVAWLHDNGDGTTTLDVTLIYVGSSATPTTGATIPVSIQNFAFTPSTIAARAGDVIVFTNNDTVPHTVTQSTTSGVGFRSDPIAPGTTYTLTIDEPGTYEFFCEFHPAMTGTIIASA